MAPRAYVYAFVLIGLVSVTWIGAMAYSQSVYDKQLGGGVARGDELKVSIHPVAP